MGSLGNRLRVYGGASLLRSALGVHANRRQGEEAGRVEEKVSCDADPRAASADPPDALETEDPFKAVPSRAERARPLFLLSAQSLDVACQAGV